MKNIYILLTKTNTVLSKTIACFTKDNYTHVSLSLDRELTQLYSFGRKYPKNPFIGGFVHEKTNEGLYAVNFDSNCAVYSIYVTDDIYCEILTIIKDMNSNRQDYKYNVLGLLTAFLGINFYRKNHYFCSEFAADVLQNTSAINLQKPPSLTKPSDFENMKELSCVYTGKLRCACK